MRVLDTLVDPAAYIAALRNDLLSSASVGGVAVASTVGTGFKTSRTSAADTRPRDPEGADTDAATFVEPPRRQHRRRRCGTARALKAPRAPVATDTDMADEMDAPASMFSPAYAAALADMALKRGGWHKCKPVMAAALARASTEAKSFTRLSDSHPLRAVLVWFEPCEIDGDAAAPELVAAMHSVVAHLCRTLGSERYAVVWRTTEGTADMGPGRHMELVLGRHVQIAARPTHAALGTTAYAGPEAWSPEAGARACRLPHAQVAALLCRHPTPKNENAFSIHLTLTTGAEGERQSFSAVVGHLIATDGDTTMEGGQAGRRGKRGRGRDTTVAADNISESAAALMEALDTVACPGTQSTTSIISRHELDCLVAAMDGLGIALPKLE